MVKRLLLLALLLGALPLHAEDTRYITDNLEVTLRSGQSTGHAIKRMLSSGTPVTVVENDRKSGWSRVRTSGGTEGWVLTRYLMDEPPPRELVEIQRQRLASLEAENQSIKQQLDALRQDRDATAGNNSQLEEENARLSQDLAAIRTASANVLAIDAENQDLKARVNSLDRELLTLQEQNAALTDRTARDWFMVGAGVVLLGILVGLILPKIRWRRKPRWDVL